MAIEFDVNGEVKKAKDIFTNVAGVKRRIIKALTSVNNEIKVLYDYNSEEQYLITSFPMKLTGIRAYNASYSWLDSYGLFTIPFPNKVARMKIYGTVSVKATVSDQGVLTDTFGISLSADDGTNSETLTCNYTQNKTIEKSTTLVTYNVDREVIITKKSGNVILSVIANDSDNTGLANDEKTSTMENFANNITELKIAPIFRAGSYYKIYNSDLTCEIYYNLGIESSVVSLDRGMWYTRTGNAEKMGIPFPNNIKNIHFTGSVIAGLVTSSSNTTKSSTLGLKIWVHGKSDTVGDYVVNVGGASHTGRSAGTSTSKVINQLVTFNHYTDTGILGVVVTPQDGNTSSPTAEKYTGLPEGANNIDYIAVYATAPDSNAEVLARATMEITYEF